MTKNTDTTNLNPEQLASALPTFAPKVWRGGRATRVYLRYPRGYQGSAGGGDLGYVDTRRGRFVGTAPADLLAQIKAALAEVRS